MSVEELRLECIRLATQANVGNPANIIKTAEMLLEFIDVNKEYKEISNG